MTLPPAPKPRSALLALLHEPLLWFLVAGFALFASYEAIRPDDKETITISRRMILSAVGYAEELRGRALMEEEYREIVASLLEDEILRREAYRRGYDERDSRVRKRLIRQMRILLSETPPEPTVAQLEEFLAANIDRYTVPPRVALDQVMFNSMEDVGPDGGTAVLAQLQGGADFTKLGIDLGFNRTLQGASEYELARAFGGRYARQVFSLDDDVWVGPLQSAGGVHYVRITGREPPAAPVFEKIESYLRMDWEMEQRRRDLDRKLETIRRQYRIVIEYVGEEEPPS